MDKINIYTFSFLTSETKLFCDFLHEKCLLPCHTLHPPELADSLDATNCLERFLGLGEIIKVFNDINFKNSFSYRIISFHQPCCIGGFWWQQWTCNSGTILTGGQLQMRIEASGFLEMGSN